MRSLWSALINTLLMGGNSDEKYVLTDEDKEELIARILKDTQLYELTEKDKTDIVNTVLESIPEQPEVSTDKLEHIATLTAEADTKSILCVADSEGNPFSLKKAVLFIRIKPAASSTTSSANLYSIVSFDPDLDILASPTAYRTNMMTSGISQTENKYLGCSIILDGIEPKTDDNGRMAVINGAPSLMTNIFHNIPEGCNGICKVGVYASSTTCFIGAGSQVKVYGVRT